MFTDKQIEYLVSMPRKRRERIFCENADVEGFDHIKLGNQLRHFVYPPTQLPDTAGYEDALKESCVEKIQELLDRAGELKREARRRAKIILSKTKRGSIEELFWKIFAESQFAEYFVIRKWLRYWSGLWRKVSNTPLPRPQAEQLNHYGYFELQQARRVPLENLYEGKLRKVGSRFVGLCPFHQEKTPSFYIFPDNHFHCYGCGAHGDSIAFIEKIKGLDFPNAVRSLI